MSNILERISLFARKKGLNIGTLEKSIGASKGVLSRAIQNGTDIQAKWLAQIVENYPDCSCEWLLTGKGPLESLADRLSEVIGIIGNISDVENSFGLSGTELSNFTNNFIFPERPFDLVRFNIDYPEFNCQWIITGEGNKFNGDQEACMHAIKERQAQKQQKEDMAAMRKELGLQPEPHEEPAADVMMYQAKLLGDQLDRKDAQINQLIDLLKKK